MWDERYDCLRVASFCNKELIMGWVFANAKVLNAESLLTIEKAVFGPSVYSYKSLENLLFQWDFECAKESLDFEKEI